MSWLTIEKEVQVDFQTKCAQCNEEIDAEVVQDKVMVTPHFCNQPKKMPKHKTVWDFINEILDEFPDTEAIKKEIDARRLCEY